MLTFSAEARARLEDNEIFDEIETFGQRIVDLRVPRISGKHISPVAKTPVKIVVLLQSGIRRALELIDSMISDFNSSRFVPTFVSARAIFETAVVLYDMADFVEEATKTGDPARVADIDDRLVRTLAGSKAKGFGDPEKYQAPNILTILARLSKKSAAFQDFYFGLSEFAHPNYSGMMGLYFVRKDEGEAEFLDNPAAAHPDLSKYSLLAASAGLQIIMDAADRFRRYLDGFTRLCEENIFNQGTWPSYVPYPPHRSQK